MTDATETQAASPTLLQVAREKAKLTQEQLAASAKVPLVIIKRGENPANLKIFKAAARKIAAALDTDVTTLFPYVTEAGQKSAPARAPKKSKKTKATETSAPAATAKT